jgi:chromosome segregation ATPase
MMDIVLATLVGVLLAATVAAAIEYYRLIRKAQGEYEKAKEVIEDVVLSFNRELNRETENLDVIAYKIEGNTAKIEAGIKKIENVEKKIAPIEEQLSTVSKESLGELSKLTGINSKISIIEESNNKLKTQITTLDEQLQKLTVLPEVKTEPVILIKRDKAMGALTSTEIAVLEFLSAEGAKTAPEIKERVKLSREHTARLMKKLYEEGYLERETGKIPFKYSVKKEMEKLLTKPQSTQA